jgi:nucleotide-binding universal stress UspA family protein
MNDLGIRTVIVPFDDSDRAERALPHAQFLATRLDAEILLLAVADTPVRGQRLQHALDHAHAQLAGQLGDTRVAYDFWTAERIVAATTPDDAVACIATNWSTGRSIARRVVFHSHGPVLLVGPRADPRPDPAGAVATASGDHPAGRSLIRTASSWAHALGLTVTLLATTDPPTAQPGTDTITVIDAPRADPTDAVLEYERHHAVTMIAATVPAGWGRRLSPSARAAGRLIRGAHAPVLAVPHR